MSETKINGYTLIHRIKDLVGEVEIGKHDLRKSAVHHLGVCYELYGKLQADLRTQGEECHLQIDENKRLREQLAGVNGLLALTRDELTNWLAERAAITKELKIEMPGEETAACLDWVLKAIVGLRTEPDKLREVVEGLVAMVDQAHRGSLDKPCGCNWCVSNWHTYTSIARAAAEKKESESNHAK